MASAPLQRRPARADAPKGLKLGRLWEDTEGLRLSDLLSRGFRATGGHPGQASACWEQFLEPSASHA